MSRRMSRRESSDSFLAGISQLGETSNFDNSISGNSRRRDDLSLAYSIDDMSRGQTYISAASDEEEEDDDDDDDFEQEGTPYYHPAMPTPVENPAPPPLPVEPDEPSTFQSFFKSPINYIFGGNDDDDISTIDGGFGGENFQWGDGDNSTIATTPTLKSLFKKKQQPTIYEDGEEDYSESAARSNRSKGNEEKQEFEPSLGAAPAKEGKELFDEEDEYDQDQDEYYEDQDEYYDDQDEYDEDDDPYAFTKGAVPTTSKSSDVESKSQHDEYPESYRKSIDTSYHSAGNSVRFSITDEDAARSRTTDDDVSLSLSAAFDKRNDPQGMLPRREPEHWTSSHSASVYSTQSQVWRRSIAHNKSWRSVRSTRTGMGSASTYSHESGGARSSRTMASMMPEKPVIISSHSPGAPMMTRGMSGRAVVHVKMDLSTDGTIESLDYAMPLVDAPVELDVENFQDEDISLAANRDRIPWYDYYSSRSKLVRTFHSRKCYRINAMILVGVALIATVSISVFALASSNSTMSSAADASTSSSSALRINDLSMPRQLAGVKLPDKLNTRLKDWFNNEGKNAPGKRGVPFYLHLPLEGALIASDCWTYCLGFTVAGDGGKAAASDPTLKSILVMDSSFVNVDLSNAKGIEHAAEAGLVPSGVPDVVISVHFEEVVNNLYSKTDPTHLIITMRHPVDRAAAMYEYLRQFDPELDKMSLEQYALSGKIFNNYVVRMLTGKNGGKLSVADVNFCKELLRRKGVVGLYENMEESLNHFERFFGWPPVTDDPVSCHQRSIQDAMAAEMAPKLDPGSAAYALLQQQNLHDISLYNYVRDVLVPFQMEVISRQG